MLPSGPTVMPDAPPIAPGVVTGDWSPVSGSTAMTPLVESATSRSPAELSAMPCGVVSCPPLVRVPATPV
jgi:hypothetical protein